MGSRLRFRSRPVRVGFGLMRACSSVRGALSFIGGGGLVSLFPDAPDFSDSSLSPVLHAFEDWSTYDDPSDIPVTNRVDGGGPWTTNGTAFQTFDLVNVNPWVSSKTVTVDLQDSPGEGQAHGRAFVLEEFLNAGIAGQCLVVEWAIRQTGTTCYAGKIADVNMQGSPNVQRHNFQTNHDPLGKRDLNGTNADPLCNKYYDNGTPRFAGLPSSPGRYGYQWARSKNSTGEIFHWNQNRNWVEGDPGSGSGFDYNEEAGSGQFTSYQKDGVWRRIILRLTLNEPGQPSAGYGRSEVWHQRDGGSMRKIMEYIGDVGGFDEGLIDTSESGSYWINPSAAIHWYDLTGQNDPGPGGFYTGGNTIHLGYFRCWTHDRLALP